MKRAENSNLSPYDTQSYNIFMELGKKNLSVLIKKEMDVCSRNALSTGIS